MATWTAPTTRSTGDLISASIWNTDLTENLKYLKDAPVLDTALIIGAATTSGIRLDLESGTLAVREGDDSAYGPLIASVINIPSTGSINFASSDVTITHSTNTLAFAGASTAYTFADGPVRPATNDGAALGVSGTAWSDLFLASGGVINFNAGDITLTHSIDILTFAGASTGFIFQNNVGVNLGSNLTTPAYALDVRTSASTNGGIRVFGDASAASNNTCGISFSHVNTFSSANQHSAIMSLLESSGNTLSSLVFATSGNASTGNATEKARINSSGVLCVNATGATGFSEKLLSRQTGTGAAGSSITGYASDSAYGYFNIVSLVERTANSAYEFLRAYSGGSAGDVEFILRGDGNGYADGTWNNNGADYAEFFESATGAALTVGSTVVLDGTKVREATASDPASAVIGVVRPKEPSKASMVVGNTAWNKWANKYLTDDFDRYIMEDHDVVTWTDADGTAHSYESHRIPAGVTVPADATWATHDDAGRKFQHYKLNPAWDETQAYVPREQRDEWVIVGLVGQVKVLKGRPVNDRWIKMRDVSASVDEWMIR